MIREMTETDITRVGEIWLEASIRAHDFVSSDFWCSDHVNMVEEILPRAEGYVYLEGEKILGFITIGGDFVYCLFVDNDRQRCGIGRKLLNHVKESNGILRLAVYQPNIDAQRFYESQGFYYTGDSICPYTQCPEVKMEWKRNA